MAGLQETIQHLLNKVTSLEALNGSLSGANSEAGQRLAGLESSVQQLLSQQTGLTEAVSALSVAVSALQTAPQASHTGEIKAEVAAAEGRVAEGLNSLKAQIDSIDTGPTTTQVGGGEYIQINNGDYRLKNADGQWGKWSKLWSGQGSGGLGRKAVIDIIHEIVTPDGNSLSTITDNLDTTYTHDDGAGNTTLIETDQVDYQSQIDVNTGDIDTNTTNITNINNRVTVLEGNGYASQAIKVNASGESDQNLSAGTTNVVGFANQVHNVGDATFDDSSNSVAVGAGGVYHISSSLYIDGPLVGVLSNVTVSIQVDSGSGFSTVAQTLEADSAVGVNDQSTVACDADVELGDEDEVRITIFYNSTLGGILQLLFSTQGELNWFSLHRVA